MKIWKPTRLHEQAKRNFKFNQHKRSFYGFSLLNRFLVENMIPGKFKLLNNNMCKYILYY